MRKIFRTMTVVLSAGLLSIGLASCAGVVERTVDYTTSAVTLAPGEALVVDFGEINPSVGDAWVVTREPDPEVLHEGELRSHYLGDEGSTGGPSHVSYRFAPEGDGTTVIEFEYQFRGSVPTDVADQRTAEITVTVG